jgi:hypothetical protein
MAQTGKEMEEFEKSEPNLKKTFWFARKVPQVSIRRKITFVAFVLSIILIFWTDHKITPFIVNYSLNSLGNNDWIPILLTRLAYFIVALPIGLAVLWIVVNCYCLFFKKPGE